MEVPPKEVIQGICELWVLKHLGSKNQNTIFLIFWRDRFWTESVLPQW